jgi:predicted transcriptional regulator
MDEIAGRIEELAQSVHKAGEPFAGQQEWIADAIERGATELNALASSLRDNDVGSLARQVRTVAQRQPALFAGLCLAGGIAIARIGKLVAADVSREDLPSLPEVVHGAQ